MNLQFIAFDILQSINEFDIKWKNFILNRAIITNVIRILIEKMENELNVFCTGH